MDPPSLLSITKNSHIPSKSYIVSIGIEHAQLDFQRISGKTNASYIVPKPHINPMQSVYIRVQNMGTLSTSNMGDKTHKVK